MYVHQFSTGMIVYSDSLTSGGLDTVALCPGLKVS